MAEIVYCKDCAYAEPNNLDAYNAVKSGVFCTRYKQNTAGVFGCDNGKDINALTNADRFFRNATNEQLAQYMDKIASCEFCPARRERCGYGHGCIDAWLEWLKQKECE